MIPLSWRLWTPARLSRSKSTLEPASFWQADLCCFSRQLERQRREIEDLKRELAKRDPTSVLLRDENLTDSCEVMSLLEDTEPADSTPHPTPQKRKTPPSNRSRSSNISVELPSVSAIGEVEGAIAQMAAELKKEGALAEAHSPMEHDVGKTCAKDIELMNMEDIDAFEFDGGGSKFGVSRVLEAPWSGLPMVTATEAVLGHCAIPL
eukprot:TRINITY_DN8010_c0_g2_i8.p1 TRINITY_DN8010_c0_g2~~TRINITY_DN8010_c0_g2_i8.p1  ORF type:complete len:207 (+),score=24.97 TRINITY_DN8010_c0_g2_i8:296-916(+)